MTTSYAVSVGIVMGSRSDMPVMERAAALLEEFGVPHEVRVLSAHRTPDAVEAWVSTAVENGTRVFIAGAGGAAHLAGVIAAHTQVPVIGVPMATQALGGLDSLLSTVQMPRGIPVATVAIGAAENAALLAVAILAISDEALAERLADYRERQTQAVLDDPANA
ncbi:MAG TPA: 5-(carboxyamino)imidazole ribonucleotide mutase [Candidatus Limnocylindrales bacterium]|nr:5-(carboxyamino)imidazole ribonucleotide mutase [Candidatus Limnocylindrales bacterium]